jgi:flagellum-specific peptidoglycan hydrolase FlgJ
MTFLTPEAFVKVLLEPAKQIEKDYKIPYLFDLAQLALESAWGKEAVGKFNISGVKADKSWTDKKVIITTTEYFKDNKQGHLFPKVISITHEPEKNRYKYVVEDWFRDYDSYYDCMIDHAKFLIENKRYAGAFKYTDDENFALEVAKAGYSTNLNYGNVLLQMINSVKKRLPL